MRFINFNKVVGFFSVLLISILSFATGAENAPDPNLANNGSGSGSPVKFSGSTPNSQKACDCDIFVAQYDRHTNPKLRNLSSGSTAEPKQTKKYTR